MIITMTGTIIEHVVWIRLLKWGNINGTVIYFMQFSDTWKVFSISSMYIAPSIMIVNENPIMDPLEIQETFDLTSTSFHL